MKVAQIRSLLARQMSTHQSTLPVLEAIIDHLAEIEVYLGRPDLTSSGSERDRGRTSEH